MKLKIVVLLSLITLVASIAPATHAQTYSVIHNFTLNGGAGSYPQAGVTLRGGDLYGTTEQGGFSGSGIVYRATRTGSDWTTIPIFSLWYRGDPQARVVFGPDGHLYSTVNGSSTGQAAFFDLVPPVSLCKTAKCFWTENTLATFGGVDGYDPGNGDLVWDQQGTVYGTTQAGGAAGYGTVYEISKSGTNWTETAIYSFSGGADGQFPQSGVILDKNGNLFGTTNKGGQWGEGTVFELTQVPGVGWQKTIIHNFSYVFDDRDGQGPVGGLIFDTSGNLYGTTQAGGAETSGTVFELSPSGDIWTSKVLYNFKSNDPCGPLASLTMDAVGNLYGTTGCEGAHGWGNVFKLSKVNGQWMYTSLYDFTGLSDGGGPFSNVTIDTDGTLYGTAASGGQGGGGVVWMIKP